MFRGHVHHAKLTLEQLKGRHQYILRKYREHLMARSFDPRHSEQLHRMLIRYSALIEARAKHPVPTRGDDHA
jgi:hypothetical protein